MLCITAVTNTICKVITSDWAIAAIVIGIMLFDRVDHWPADLHGFIKGLRFDAIGAVMARTPFNHRHFCIRDQLEQIPRFRSNILNTMMT